MPASDQTPLLNAVLPAFAAEIENALDADGHRELASQVASLLVVDVCGCGDDFSASFYTGPKPDGPWGDRHESILASVADGLVVLDVVDGVIRYVEVLYRDDVRNAILPPDSGS